MEKTAGEFSLESGVSLNLVAPGGGLCLESCLLVKWGRVMRGIRFGGWESCGTCWECVRDFYFIWGAIDTLPKNNENKAHAHTLTNVYMY